MISIYVQFSSPLSIHVYSSLYHFLSCVILCRKFFFVLELDNLLYMFSRYNKLMEIEIKVNKKFRSFLSNILYICDYIECISDNVNLGKKTGLVIVFPCKVVFYSYTNITIRLLSILYYF